MAMSQPRMRTAAARLHGHRFGPAVSLLWPRVLLMTLLKSRGAPTRLFLSVVIFRQLVTVRRFARIPRLPPADLDHVGIAPPHSIVMTKL